MDPSRSKFKNQSVQEISLSANTYCSKSTQFSLFGAPAIEGEYSESGQDQRDQKAQGATTEKLTITAEGKKGKSKKLAILTNFLSIPGSTMLHTPRGDKESSSHAKKRISFLSQDLHQTHSPTNLASPIAIVKSSLQKFLVGGTGKSPHSRSSDEEIALDIQISRSKYIEQYLVNEKIKFKKSANEPKILILGSSESGKTTILKLFKLQSGGNLVDDVSTQMLYRAHIVKVLLKQLSKLITMYSKSTAAIQTHIKQYCGGTALSTVSNEPNQPNSAVSNPPLADDPRIGFKASIVFATTPTTPINDKICTEYFDILLLDDDLQYLKKNEQPEISAQVRTLVVEACKDPRLHYTLSENWNLFPDNFEYFMQRAEEITDPIYSPTENDVLMIYFPTESMHETVTTFDDKKHHFIDIPGMNRDKPQWLDHNLQYFENVQAAIFVVSLSFFDQFDKTDASVNRLADALVLFDQISSHTLLEKSTIILFLTKKDILKKKAARVSMSKFFPNYKGEPHNAKDYLDFISKLFRRQNNAVVHALNCVERKGVSAMLPDVLTDIL